MKFVNLSAINMAKKYGFTPKNSTNGKKIGTKIINISVHSNGQPNKKNNYLSYN